MTMTWKKLLVPHDFSPCAGRALMTAAGLAKVHGSEIALLHVSDLPPNLTPDMLVTPAHATEPVRAGDYLTQGARHELELIAASLRRDGLVVQVIATLGDVAGEILRVASERKVDAIVVGTHGRSGLSHLLLGSVAEKIMRGANVPVVTVRTPAPEAKPTAEEARVEDELAG